jgi:hypothetical protein
LNVKGKDLKDFYPRIKKSDTESLAKGLVKNSTEEDFYSDKFFIEPDEMSYIDFIEKTVITDFFFENFINDNLKKIYNGILGIPSYLLFKQNRPQDPLRPQDPHPPSQLPPKPHPPSFQTSVDPILLPMEEDDETFIDICNNYKELDKEARDNYFNLIKAVFEEFIKLEYPYKFINIYVML